MQSDGPDQLPSNEAQAPAPEPAPKSTQFVMPVRKKLAHTHAVEKYATLVAEERPLRQEPKAGPEIPESQMQNIDWVPDTNLDNREPLRCPVCLEGILEERSATCEAIKCLAYALCCVLLLFVGRICIYIPGEQGQYECSNCNKSFDLVPNRLQD